MRDRMKAAVCVALVIASGCGSGTHESTIATADEPQYLNFVIDPPGLLDQTGDGAGDPTMIHDLIDAEVSTLVAKIGATGDGETRVLGFHYSVPIWTVDTVYPGKTANIIAQAFRVAAERNVAFHFSIETHYYWSTRPDLFNYFQPMDPSYNADNKANVEWSDWQGTPSLNRYVDHGVPVNLQAPHMCYLAAKIQSEVARLGGIVGTAMKQGSDALVASGQSVLFSGITVTSELSLDNYTNIDKIDPGMGQLMTNDGAPKVRYGYCSFTALGYSAANPPADVVQAAATVNKRWLESWAMALANAGVPMTKLYSHVAGPAGTSSDPAFDLLNAPDDTAFTDFDRPGWTTYPVSSLHDNFQVLYDELAAHGNPHWGGTEAAPFDGASVPVYDYLSRHYDHGAVEVTMNVGATGNLADQLSQAVFGPSAISDYQRFLRGQ